MVCVCKLRDTVNFIQDFGFRDLKTESRYEKFKSEKEEEQLDMQRNYKRKLSDADVKLR